MGFIILLGILTIGSGYSLFLPEDSKKLMFISIGSALISAGTVGIFSKFFLSEVTSEAISKKVEEPLAKLDNQIAKTSTMNIQLFKEMSEFQNKIEHFSKNYSIVIQCMNLGIVEILNDRISSLEIPNKILEEMWKSKKVKMLGTSLRQFFWKDEKLNAEFKKVIQSNENGRHFQILISNPFSPSVAKRTLLEQGTEFEDECKRNFDHFKTSETYDDIRRTVNNFLQLHLDKTRVELKIYSDFPSMWLIITDDFAFFQPYQYGKIQTTRCIGESFFIMKIHSNSQLYNLLNQHFDILWDDHSNLSPEQMLVEFKNAKTILNYLLQEKRIFWRK